MTRRRWPFSLHFRDGRLHAVVRFPFGFRRTFRLR